MYRLGPITIDLVGRGPMLEKVRDELSVLERVDDEDAAVVFRFTDKVSMPAGALCVGPWRMGRHCVAGDVTGYSFCMRCDDGKYVVDVASNRRRQWPGDALWRVWDWNYLGPLEKRAKNFMYGLFDTVTALSLLEQLASYVHASSFSYRGEATAIVAWGGVGKTTSVLKLMAEQGVRFLSDDLGLVEAGGRAWRTPKRLQIYGYNVDGERSLKRRLLRGRGPLDRLNWYWRGFRFGPKKVRRRVEVEELFGDQSAAVEAPLRRVLFLERADIGEARVDKLESTELARRAAAILVDELDVLFQWAVAAESHGVDIGLPSCRQLRASMTAVLEEAFSRCETGRIRVPQTAGPGELVEAIWEVVGA